MAVVRLANLTKRYPRSDEPAVHDVSLEVGDGEFVALLGPSGCGKSTTLRMIAGLEEITEGELFIDDRLVNGVPAKDRDIAMVFQSYALYPHMTIEDNLGFGLRRRSVPAIEIDRRVKDVAAMLGLTGLLRRKPHSLSGGQRQRVALGRAIVRDPKVFLFDEPLSNLDAALRLSTRGEIVRLHQRLGATMIYVTHDQVEAMTMSQRMCIMNGGRVVQTGKPLEIYRDPADTFVARFLGSPPMNLIDVALSVDGERVVARFGDGTFLLAGWRPATSPLIRAGRSRWDFGRSIFGCATRDPTTALRVRLRSWSRSAPRPCSRSMPAVQTSSRVSAPMRRPASANASNSTSNRSPPTCSIRRRRGRS